LTDTFGTPVFLRAFNKPVPHLAGATTGAALTSALATKSTIATIDGLSATEPPFEAPMRDNKEIDGKPFAQVFTGVRQDSGDPAAFVKTMREFYDKQGIKEKKTIVFSDSLNIDLCFQYKKISEEAGLSTYVWCGDFSTNDLHLSTGKKSVPLIIVTKQQVSLPSRLVTTLARIQEMRRLFGM
jgi:nicotinate phosphoribosyltransferase